ncbi:hypothetical protein [Streptomyces alboflavus]|uniref:hypothetical protein n=1 Tax=Streptomyces alboflavus TaxID=67267 RepID=UPI000F658E7C|nr:hypothetical protein [Streptomyces alboflavus]
MSVRETVSAGTLLQEASAAAMVGEVVALPAEDVQDLAAGFVVGEPVVALAAAVLGKRYVDRYAAARVLGMGQPE